MHGQFVFYGKIHGRKRDRWKFNTVLELYRKETVSCPPRETIKEIRWLGKRDATERGWHEGNSGKEWKPVGKRPSEEDDSGKDGRMLWKEILAERKYEKW